ncbi:hypothetical protein, partial [Thiolapillus sp.]|uniref:hypothetical protein n=1 Tax=Thiolapillus sp. TaxID=2017437 RepID=UPI003AF9D9E3
MTRTAGAPIGCQRPSRFWGLGCPKIYHEAEDTLVLLIPGTRRVNKGKATGCFSRLITQARLTQHWPLTYCAKF